MPTISSFLSTHELQAHTLIMSLVIKGLELKSSNDEYLALESTDVDRGKADKDIERIRAMMGLRLQLEA